MMASVTTSNMRFIERQGNKLYYRCPHCGDSKKNLDKGHLIIYADSGDWHCHRCQAQGHYSLGDMINLIALDVQPTQMILPRTKWKITELPDSWKPIIGNGPSGRYSGVSRRFFRKDNHGAFEMFEMKDRLGKTTGWTIRSVDVKESRIIGTEGLGYQGASLDLLDTPIRVVEGPYDVLSPVDVCVYGLPTLAAVQELKWRPLILCPDGDVWNDATLLRRWLDAFKNSWVVGVEVLPDGLDPDEVPIRERRQITYGDAVSKIYGQRNLSNTLPRQSSKVHRSLSRYLQETQWTS